MRTLVTALIGMVALTPLAGWADQDQDPQALLRKTERAIESLNYEGTFVHIVDGQVDTMYVVHRVEDGIATERLVSLDGPRREVIRDQDEVTCIFSDQKSVLVSRRKDDGPLRAAVPRFTDSLQDHYRFRSMRSVNKLGRDAAVIAIEPQDDLRYGYKLWIDKDTAMLLKAQVVDRYRKVVEQLIFVSLELPETIPAERLEPSITAEGYARYVQGETSESEQISDRSSWQASKLPSGFRLTATNVRVMAGASYPTEHLVYTDGLASVSVFIDPGDGEEVAPDGASRIGAANAFTTRVGPNVVTAMGEVPAVTVKMIARSIKRQPDTPVAAQ
jgi:sigma-E factor negative regulatory protein RseB